MAVAGAGAKIMDKVGSATLVLLNTCTYLLTWFSNRLTLIPSLAQIDRLAVLTAQLSEQEERVELACDKISQVAPSCSQVLTVRIQGVKSQTEGKNVIQSLRGKY